MKTAIIIPARYSSTRFPGKPLKEIAGRSMLSRVVDIARAAAQGQDRSAYIAVATEDERIAGHCREIGIDCIMTSEDCPTGSDRVLEAAEKAGGDFDYVLNLQGDAPFTDPVIITRLLEELHRQSENIEIITPVHRLSWEQLDALRESKKAAPFSGTTVTRDNTGHALYFSKNILPAIRNENEMRQNKQECPVFQHIGIYGFRMDVLNEFVALKQTENEKNEGLEQLRWLENGRKIFTVKVKFKNDVALRELQGGIDSPEDIDRAEEIIARHGEPFDHEQSASGKS